MVHYRARESFHRILSKARVCLLNNEEASSLTCDRHSRAIFNWVSKVIHDCISFPSLRSVIGSKNSRHLLNQSDAKLKPIVTWSLKFSRAWGWSLAPFEIFRCYDWPLWLFWFWFYDTQSKNALYFMLTFPRRFCDIPHQSALFCGHIVLQHV